MKELSIEEMTSLRGGQTANSGNITQTSGGVTFTGNTVTFGAINVAGTGSAEAEFQVGINTGNSVRIG